jgi:hypothetical protein
LSAYFVGPERTHCRLALGNRLFQASPAGKAMLARHGGLRGAERGLAMNGLEASTGRRLSGRRGSSLA